MNAVWLEDYKKESYYDFPFLCYNLSRIGEYMKSDRKQTILFIIILLVMSMGVGYAFLTTTLSIDGVSDIDSSSWDIHFDNLELYD